MLQEDFLVLAREWNKNYSYTYTYKRTLVNYT